MVRLLLIKIVLLFPVLLYAQQNLIINGDFEENPIYTEKYQNFHLDQIKPWKAIRLTPDYYNAKGSIGPQSPHSGNAYAGIFVYLTPEYFQGDLKCPLIKGQNYYFEMYVNLSNLEWDGLFATDDMDAFFSPISLEKTTKDLTTIKPQISNKKFHILSDTTSWMKVSGTFIAKGSFMLCIFIKKQ
jgi:hypothetical protein